MNTGWKIAPIGDVASLTERLETPVPGIIYRQIGVRLWGEGAYEREPMDGGDTQYKSLNRVKKGDIIVNKIWARNGSVSVVTNVLEGCYCSSEFPIFIPCTEKLDPSWFHLITKTRWFWQSCEQKSQGTSGKNRIKPSSFLEIEIPLPSIDEQSSIINKIESLTDKINQAKQLRQEILNDTTALLVAMAHRSDLSDQEKEKQGWKKTRLADVLTQAQNPVDVEAGNEYPHFGIYSFAKGLFKKSPLIADEIKATKLYRVHHGQFIYSRLKAFEGAYGKINPEFDKHFVSNEFPTFTCNSKLITPEFLEAYFKSSIMWKTLAVDSKGVGSRRERLKPQDFLKHCLWLPPIQWQEKIKAATIKIQAIRTEQHSADSELDALLPAILDKAFKGELV